MWCRRSVLRVPILALASLLAAERSSALTTVWTWPGTAGWTDPGVWSLGVPAPATTRTS